MKVVPVLPQECLVPEHPVVAKALKGIDFGVLPNGQPRPKIVAERVRGIIRQVLESVLANSPNTSADKLTEVGQTIVNVRYPVPKVA
ncbi:hypothetical protein JW752_04885 [Candidatus Peregrinibacteria bacterium]|nr:hypothetical protein [Candidatus Peregrinibacteria bacterium]